MSRLSAFALMLSLCCWAQAQESPSAPETSEEAVAAQAPAPTPARRVPIRGPVTVTADHAEWAQGGAMVYTGRVKLSSTDLELRGARLELRQFEDRQFEAKVSGAPAQLAHRGVQAQGKRGDPVQARANSLHYDAREGMVQLRGDAFMKRGSDEISGENIRYDVVRRRIQASGSDQGQVRITILPPAPASEVNDDP